MGTSGAITPDVGAVQTAGQAPTANTFWVELREGATVRALRALATTAGTQTFELTAGEIASITDWSALRIALVASGTQRSVSWVELKAPAGAMTEAPGAGTSLLSGLEPTLTQGAAPITITPDAGAVILAGAAGSVQVQVAVEGGAIVLVGQAPSALSTELRTPDAGAVVLAGTIIKKYAIDKIDLFKIDIEGGEYAAFEAIDVELLKKINNIIFEFHHNKNDELEPILRKLEQAGFIYNKYTYIEGITPYAKTNDKLVRGILCAYRDFPYKIKVVHLLTTSR